MSMKRNCAKCPNTVQSRLLGRAPWKNCLSPSQRERAARSLLAMPQMTCFRKRHMRYITASCCAFCQRMMRTASAVSMWFDITEAGDC